jgi:tetratricopeptide (TPR) repeat protein
VLNIRQIAAELGASHVLGGSVRREGDSVRMSLHLIDAASDRHLWAESYTREVGSSLALQAEIALAVANELGARVTSATPVQASPRIDPVALGYYLQAKQVVDGETSDFRQRQLALLDRALDIAPDFGAARAERCITLAEIEWFAQGVGLRSRAQSDLTAAQRLAPDEPITHAAHAFLLYYIDGDFAGAQAVVASARQRWPLAADLAYLDALLMRRVGRFEESLPLFELAARLDPRNENYLWEHMEALTHISRDYRAAGAVAEALFSITASPDNRGAMLRARFLATGDRVPLNEHSMRAAARFEANGDSARASLERLALARERGDAEAAERLLATWPEPGFGISGKRHESVAAERAVWALRRGDRRAARAHYAEALRYYQAQLDVAQVQSWVRMRLAILHAALGEHALAESEYRRALADAENLTDHILAAEIQQDRVAYLLWRGDHAGAVAQIRTQLRAPYGLHAAYVVNEPWLAWKLGDDPGFQALRLELQAGLAANAAHWPAPAVSD